MYLLWQERPCRHLAPCTSMPQRPVPPRLHHHVCRCRHHHVPCGSSSGGQLPGRPGDAAGGAGAGGRERSHRRHQVSSLAPRGGGGGGAGSSGQEKGRQRDHIYLAPFALTRRACEMAYQRLSALNAEVARSGADVADVRDRYQAAIASNAQVSGMWSAAGGQTMSS